MNLNGVIKINLSRVYLRNSSSYCFICKNFTSCDYSFYQHFPFFHFTVYQVNVSRNERRKLNKYYNIFVIPVKVSFTKHNQLTGKRHWYISSIFKTNSNCRRFLIVLYSNMEEEDWNGKTVSQSWKTNNGDNF